MIEVAAGNEEGVGIGLSGIENDGRQLGSPRIFTTRLFGHRAMKIVDRQDFDAACLAVNQFDPAWVDRAELRQALAADKKEERGKNGKAEAFHGNPLHSVFA